MQEQDAIRQCQAGEESALGVLHELHHRAVFRTAYGIVRSYDLAEDVTQQVFIELFASIGRYDVTRPFPPWLHRIAVNRSVDELRRRKNLNVPLEAVHDLQSPSTSPEEAAEESPAAGKPKLRLVKPQAGSKNGGSSRGPRRPRRT